jgi:hypothetical protein
MSEERPSRRVVMDRRLAIGCAVLVLALVVALALIALIGWVLGRLGLEHTVTRFKPQLLWTAGALTALWLGIMGAIRVIRQPRTPREGPATSTLRSESPAVANMLVEDFRPTRESAAATLLDLAARGFVDIEGTDPARTVVRVRKRDEASVTGYERMVLQLLRARTVNGVVPAGALTTGTQADAREWWRRFRKEVEGEARARGLSRDLWDTRILWLLAALALIPSPLVGLAYFELGAAIAALAPGIALISYTKTRNRQRDTPAGLEAASGWLGVRRHLRDDPAFPDLPPGAVTVWERYLAYGAALGAARGTVRALPLGAEDDHLAWSTQGGVWREVRVRYPTLWPPAWGALPRTALTWAIGAGILAVLLLWTTVVLGSLDRDPTVPAILMSILRWLAVVMGVAGVLLGSWAAVALVRALRAFGPPREIRGQVVRLRTFGRSSKSPGVHHVAIDDGTTDRIRACRIPHEVWERTTIVQYGDAVAQVIPRLGRVISIRMTS